jgi:hypothetical protein
MTDSVDTDGDGMSDHDEVVVYGTDPLQVDSNANGVTDNNEGGTNSPGCETWSAYEVDGTMAAYATGLTASVYEIAINDDDDDALVVAAATQQST